MSRYDDAPTDPRHGGKMTDDMLDAERRTAISAAEAIMHTVLGYMPDEPGDAAIIRERIQKWLALDAVRWSGSRR